MDDLLKEKVIELKKYNKTLSDDNNHLNMQLKQALKDYDKEFQRNQKALEYIEERFEYNHITGEYSLKSMFNKDNIKELYDILVKEVEEIC